MMILSASTAVRSMEIPFIQEPWTGTYTGLLNGTRGIPYRLQISVIPVGNATAGRSPKAGLSPIKGRPPQSSARRTTASTTAEWVVAQTSGKTPLMRFGLINTWSPGETNRPIPPRWSITVWSALETFPVP
ncbi:MAG: hypothetical protein HZB32_00835 [Nitrospirae bacterium]|nr:hypothetical protein [Nitrospirota bacterium]